MLRDSELHAEQYQGKRKHKLIWLFCFAPMVLIIRRMSFPMNDFVFIKTSEQFSYLQSYTNLDFPCRTSYETTVSICVPCIKQDIDSLYSLQKSSQMQIVPADEVVVVLTGVNNATCLDTRKIFKVRFILREDFFLFFLFFSNEHVCFKITNAFTVCIGLENSLLRKTNACRAST